MPNQYLLATVFGFALNALFFLLFVSHVRFKKFCLLHFRLVTAIIFIAYILYAFFLPGEINDVRLFGSVGYMLRSGIDLYYLDEKHTTYPFFPLLSFYYVPANFISENFRFITFSSLLKLLTISAAFLTARFFKTRQEKISFLLHPAVFAAAVFHGQPDIILILFFVAAMQLIDKHTIYAGVLFGLSILTKTWSLFFLPFITTRRKFIKLIFFFAGAAGIIFFDIFLYTRLYHSSFRVVFQSAIGHPGSPFGNWGISFFLSELRLSPLPLINKYWTIGIFALGNLLTWKRNLPLLKGVQFMILLFMVFALGWGIQYTLWVIPFTYLLRDKERAETFGALCICYLFFGYVFIAFNSPAAELMFRLTGLIPWGYACFWLAADLTSCSNYDYS